MLRKVEVGSRTRVPGSLPADAIRPVFFLTSEPCDCLSCDSASSTRSSMRVLAMVVSCSKPSLENAPSGRTAIARTWSCTDASHGRGRARARDFAPCPAPRTRARLVLLLLQTCATTAESVLTVSPLVSAVLPRVLLASVLASCYRVPVFLLEAVSSSLYLLLLPSVHTVSHTRSQLVPAPPSCSYTRPQQLAHTTPVRAHPTLGLGMKCPQSWRRTPAPQPRQ